jgi:mannosylglycerate hydrolase
MTTARAKSSPVAGASATNRAFVVSHTHWDREWYLTQRQFQVLLAETLDEVMDALEIDPAFRTFVADGQTSIVQDYLELRPQRSAQLLRLAQAGRLAAGPWYTMPDLWLPSGEALIRNLLRGRLDCERMGIRPQQVGYVPDSFGHIEQMPQILNGFGIDSYFFSRGL